MPAYGNNSQFVRGINATIAVTWKAFICLILGPGLLYLDIASGANYFQGAFEPYMTGSFNLNLPLLGWHIDWAHATMLGFMISAICSGIQIALWNFSKTNLQFRQLKPQHIGALVMAGAIFLLDIASDMGGATMWVSNTTNGALWPESANMFQMITIPVVVIAGVANEAILEFFFGIDRPMSVSRRRRPIRTSPEKEKVSTN